MSDTEDIQIVEQELNEEFKAQGRDEDVAPVKARKAGAVYKAPRADDKRKETSKMNIEKARQCRNFKLNEQKKKKMEETLDKLNQVEIQDADSEESEDEIFLTKAKTKNKKAVKPEPQQTYQNDRLDRIEGILAKIARKHKTQKEDRKTIIQLQQAPAPVDDMTKQLKNKLLLKL